MPAPSLIKVTTPTEVGHPFPGATLIECESGERQAVSLVLVLVPVLVPVPVPVLVLRLPMLVPLRRPCPLFLRSPADWSEPWGWG